MALTNAAQLLRNSFRLAGRENKNTNELNRPNRETTERTLSVDFGGGEVPRRCGRVSDSGGSHMEIHEYTDR
jgi:hypothetical protein